MRDRPSRDRPKRDWPKRDWPKRDWHRSDWHGELAAVAREGFVPDTIWLGTENGYAALHRADDPIAWRRHVTSDEPIVTQVDNGSTAPGQLGHIASSSTSQPSVVALMLAAAELRPGLRVLEIGTGTGWNAALLCARLSDAAVVSVEVDPDVARCAALALAAGGYHPTLVTADGAQGVPAQAPYDRVLATVAVIGRVPYAWVEQTRSGGLVITPWGSEYCNGALLRLRVGDDGTARGRFHQSLAFIRLRDGHCPIETNTDNGTEGAEVATTTMREWEIHEATSVRGGAFAVGLRVPDCRLRIEHNPHGHVVHLREDETGSWARALVDAAPFEVHRCGPRDLWAEVVAAYRWWCAADRPAAGRFGITVTPTGQQVWLDDPANVLD